MTLDPRTVSLLLLLTTGAAAAPKYQISPVFSGVPSSGSAAISINESGDVLALTDVGAERPNPFIWNNGAVQLLPSATEPDILSVPRRLGEGGMVVGRVTTASSSYTAPAAWTSHGVQYLLASGRKASGTVNDVNALGQVIGTVQYLDGWHAMMWQGGTSNDLGTFGAKMASAVAINDRSEVVITTLDQSDHQQTLIWNGSIATPLGTLGSKTLYPEAINNVGQVVGGSSGDEIGNAFLWSDGALVDLGTLPGARYSVASAINDGGNVVGWATGRPDGLRAVLWSNQQIIDLNALLPLDSGWVLQSATGINNLGQIVGAGTYLGEPAAFLLTPTDPTTVPEPAAALAALAGLALLPLRRRTR